jgi:hypothetical protein
LFGVWNAVAGGACTMSESDLSDQPATTGALIEKKLIESLDVYSSGLFHLKHPNFL